MKIYPLVPPADITTIKVAEGPSRFVVYEDTGGKPGKLLYEGPNTPEVLTEVLSACVGRLVWVTYVYETTASFHQICGLR